MTATKSAEEARRVARESPSDWDAATEALFVVLAAALVALCGGAFHCYEFSECRRQGLCSNASHWRPMEMSCSFLNYVSVTGDAVYGQHNGSSHATLTRGVCAPGERLHINSVTGASECAPWRAWPNALNTEIMQPEASAMHEKMCGAWIRAGPALPQRVKRWSFYDSDNEDLAVTSVANKLFASSRLSATDMGKFYASCQHTVLSGSSAIRASAKKAYEHLKAGLGDLAVERRILEAVGWLASHHCDGPVQLGVTVSGSGSFVATAYRGSKFDAGAFAEALYAVDEPAALQSLAETGNRLINAQALASPVTSFAQLEYLFEGATNRTDHANVSLAYTPTPELDGLVWLTTQSRFAEAAAYLHGQAAMCAFALQGALDVAAAGEWSNKARTLRRLRAARPRASALGRLSTQGETGASFGVNPSNETLAQASTVTWSQLRAAPAGAAAADCTGLATFLFPDRLDEEHFGIVITDELYERMRAMTVQLRESVAHVVQHHANISAVVQNGAAVAAAVRATKVRVAGAPRGSWAAIERGFADGQLQSSDGPMLMALKQSRAVFDDRTNLLFDDANPCTAPPVYDALEANAYIYPTGACTHFMLGVLRKPFADERYDEVSLATRFGYIMGHEFAHNTLGSKWSASGVAALLNRYAPNLHSEALADIVSALAVVHAGLATGAQVCAHVSQIWCARVPPTYAPDDGDTHPGPNVRGDLLCQTLADLGEL